MEPIAFGVDFGTTNSIVCAWGSQIRQALQNEKPIALWDTSVLEQLGKRPHPSVVWYAPGKEAVVGHDAKSHMLSYDGMGHAFVRSIKRRLGRNEEVELTGGRRKPAFEIAAEIFRHLKKDAEKHASLAPLGGKRGTISECVVTVPVNYNGLQRRDIRQAMERAGLRLRCFLHEPFAALIGHFYNSETKLQQLRGKRVLVFDWGGGTLDVCLAEVSEDGSEVVELAHDGIDDRAGDDFDKKIMTDLKRRFLGKSGLKLDDVPVKGSAADRFWGAAERAKIELSTNLSASVEVANFIEIYGKPIDLEEKIERDQFENLILDEVIAAEACVHRCLKKARMSSAGLVDHVLMVGGTSCIPAVRQMLEKTFGARVAVATEPDAAIARGAAIVAAERWEPFNVKPIAVKLSDESFFTVLPAKREFKASESTAYTFYCTDPRPAVANLMFYEQAVRGDDEYRALNAFLAVPSDPKIREIANLDRIIARFVITDDATLWCEAQSSSTGEMRSCEIYDVSFGLKLK
jgi:molecular chaperone DnaK (HSP70)